MTVVAEKPLALSDSQLESITRAALPLPPDTRSQFLVDVASALRGAGEIGDGAVYRAVSEVQRKYFDAPDLAGSGPRSKYR